VLRRKETRLACAVLLCSVCVALGLSADARGAGASESIRVDFETATVGELPTGFSPAVTGGGGPAEWRVVDDATAPSGGKVLAQTSTDKTSYRFPICIFDRLAAKDVEVSVTFKPVSGTVDQAAGIVARYRDRDNYYIVRANALEDNVRLYKVERGKRRQFAGVNVKVPVNEWETLTLEVKGTHFRVLLNGTRLFEADDATFKEAGKVGLWTKADSVTSFDDLTVKADAAR
jgi:hypothetical protein